jgi:hypothetical protein
MWLRSNGNFIGPTTLYPGESTPAVPGETVMLYANGFGPTTNPIVSGSVTQSGTLPSLPVVTIGGLSAQVVFAGLVSPGELQMNVVIPATAPNGDNPLIATYDGASTQAGAIITVASSSGGASGLTIVSGNNQSTPVNTAFPQPLVVKVANAQGGVVSGAQITWTVAQGSGTISSVSGATNSIGETTASISAGASAGTLVIKAAYGSSTVQFNLTVTAGSAGPPTLTVTSYETTGGLITDTSGNTVNCSIPTPKVAFQTTDVSAGVWFLFDNANVGDVLLVNWVHPNGAIDSNQPTVRISQAGPGCYSTFLNIKGSAGASILGAWQVKLLVNGVTAFTLPFFIGPITPPSPITITSLSTGSPAPLSPLYIKSTGLNTSAPVQVTFSNTSGYSVTQSAIRVLSDGTVVAAVPIYANANGQTSAATLSLTVSQGNTSSPPVSVAVQNLPSVASYGTNPGDISRAFLNYEAMALGQRINELQALAGLRGNTVDVSDRVSQLQTTLNAVIAARSDVDRVSGNSTTVINGGTLSNGTPILFNSTALDAMDRVLGSYLTQLMPYMAAPPFQHSSRPEHRLPAPEPRSGRTNQRDVARADPPAS